MFEKTHVAAQFKLFSQAKIQFFFQISLYSFTTMHKNLKRKCNTDLFCKVARFVWRVQNLIIEH
jgi:hypothetical protein